MLLICLFTKYNHESQLESQKQPPEGFYKKGIFTNFAKFTGKHLCQSVFLNKVALAQVFPGVFCKNSKNTFFTEHLRTTASRLISFVIQSL